MCPRYSPDTRMAARSCYRALGRWPDAAFQCCPGSARSHNTWIFVSRGVGTVYVPISINCPPEVAIVTLKRDVREVVYRYRIGDPRRASPPSRNICTASGYADAPPREFEPPASRRSSPEEPALRAGRRWGRHRAPPSRDGRSRRSLLLRGRSPAAGRRVPGTRATAMDECSGCALGNASRSGAPTRRMKPARQTSPTSRARSSLTRARSYASRVAKAR